MNIALITGANSGIGLATALELARNGYRVLAGMRTVAKGAELAQVAAAEKLAIELVQLDVTDTASLDAAVQTVLKRHARIDVLINNAGVGIIGPIEDIDLHEARQGFEINLFGPMRLVQLMLPGMRARKAGCIVNVSSVTGRFTTSAQGFYSASKYALAAASEALAQEVRQFGIRVVVIEPGVTRTPALQKIPNIKPDSPYLPLLLRAGRTLGTRIALAMEPTVVAQAIRNAIESPEYRFRHPVGADTHQWIAGRARITDEQWIDYGRELSEEELRKFWRTNFGMDV